MKIINLLLVTIMLIFLLSIGFVIIGNINKGKTELNNIYIKTPTIYRACIDYLNNPYLKSNLQKSRLLILSKPIPKLHSKVKETYQSSPNDFKENAKILSKYCLLLKRAYEHCSEICKNIEDRNMCFLNFIRKAEEYCEEKNKYFWDLLINEKSNEVDNYIFEACSKVHMNERS